MKMVKEGKKLRKRGRRGEEIKEERKKRGVKEEQRQQEVANSYASRHLCSSIFALPTSLPLAFPSHSLTPLILPQPFPSY